MGRAKEVMLDEFQKEAVALEFLVEVETLERCPIHEDYTYDLGSLEDAIELAKKMDFYDKLPKGFTSSGEFIQYLERAYMNNAGFECALCGKYCMSD